MIKYIYPSKGASQRTEQQRELLRQWVRTKHRRGLREILQNRATRLFGTDSDVYRRVYPLWTPKHPLWLLSDVVESLTKWLNAKYNNRVDIRLDKDGWGCQTVLRIVVHFPELRIADSNDNVYISKDVFAILTIPFADSAEFDGNYVSIQVAIKKLSWTHAERREGYISSHVSPTSTNTADNLCWGGEGPESTLFTSDHPTSIMLAAKIFQYMLMLETLLSNEYSNSETGHRPFKSFATVIEKHVPVPQRDVYLNYLLPRYLRNEALINHHFTLQVQDLGFPYVKARLKPEVLAQLTEDQDVFYKIDNQYFKSTQSSSAPSLKQETFRFKGEYWESRFVESTAGENQVVEKALPPAEVKLLETIISRYLTKKYYELFININRTHSLTWANSVEGANIPEVATEDSVCEPISQNG